MRPSVEPDETTHVYSGRVDLGKLLVSAGIAPGPRQRFDPRVEPDSRIEVTSPRRVR